MQQFSQFLIPACALAAMIGAIIGLVLISRLSPGRRVRSGTDLFFACMGVLGILVLMKTGLPGIFPMVVFSPQLSAASDDTAAAGLRRIAAALGVAPNKPFGIVTQEILRKLPAQGWHMTPTERNAFGMALDEISMDQRFPIVVRSIPSDENSISFSNEISEVLRQHHWASTGVREFGIKRDVSGIAIALSSSVHSENDVPLPAKRLIVILEKAGFAPYGVMTPDVEAGRFQLLIGNGPRRAD